MGNERGLLTVYDYYAMLGVDRRAMMKEIKARHNTSLIFQSPRMQAVQRRAYQVLSDPRSRSLLDALLDASNTYVINNPHSPFVPERLAGCFWNSTMDPVGRALRVHKIRDIHIEAASQSEAFQTSISRFVKNPTSERNRRVFISAFNTQLQAHLGITQVFLDALGVTVVPDPNQTYRESVEEAIANRPTEIMASLDAEIQRLIPPQNQPQLYSGGLFDSYAKAIEVIVSSVRLSADQVTGCATELAAVSRGRYVRRANRNSFSENLIVMLDTSVGKGWLGISIATGGNSIAQPSDPLPRPIDLAAMGFDVVAVKVPAHLTSVEVVRAVATRHAELYAEREQSPQLSHEPMALDLSLGYRNQNVGTAV